MEKAFPRGGVKPYPQTTKGHIERRNSDDLFKVKNDSETSQDKRKRKRKKKKENASKSTADEEVAVAIEPLSFKTLTTDMVTLGYVTAVREYELKVTLPGCIVGTVSIANISRIYTDLLKRYSEEPSSVEETIISPLGLFAVGQSIKCKVISIKNDPETSKTEVALSLDPADVNGNLTASCLFHGMPLQVAVASVEDHGYTIDIGIRSLKAFLKNSAASSFIRAKNQGRQLTVGQILPCVVDMPKLSCAESLEGRTVNLSAKLTVVAGEKVPDIAKITLQSLQPGMKLSATIMDIKNNGLIVDCMSYTGCIFKDNFKNIWDKPQQYKMGQEVEGVVLYIHPLLQHIYLSLNFVTSPPKIEKMFGEIKIGSLVEGKVHHIDRVFGVYFTIEGKFKGLCHRRHLSDNEIEDVSKEFPLSSTHKCRVLGFCHTDHLLKLSLKKSIVNQKYIPHEELKVGEKFKGTVKKLVPNGMVVKLAHGIQGFVRDFDMSDIRLRNPEKIFHPGKEVKCRILKADISRDPPSLLLTCKKTLVKSKLPIIAKYEDCYPGMLAEGTIALIKESGVLVLFYNDVKGWVPPNELSTQKIPYPEKVFYKGQVVKCCVISCIPEKQNLKLSFRIDGQVLHSDISQANLLEVGKIVDVEVIAVSEKGLDVALVSQNVAAFLPVGHLSDHKVNCPVLLSTYQVGDVIKDVVCFSVHGIAIVSKKSTLIHAAKENKLIKKFSDLKVGIIVPAVIRGFASYGMFVEVSNNISGLVPSKMMLNERVIHAEKAGFSLHQTVMAKIVNIEEERDRVTFSTKLADCYFGEGEPSLDLLESYIEDQVKIQEFYKEGSGLKKKLSSLAIGQVLNATVTNVTEVGLICEIEKNIPALAVKQHLGGLVPSVGDKLQAVVLYIDIMNECVELLLDPSLVKTFSKLKDKESAKPRIGQVIKCQVAVMKHDFIIVLLKAHAVGNIAYLPMRRHLNDLHGRSDLYALGDFHHIVIKRITGNSVLGILKQHDHTLESLLEKAMSGRKWDNLSSKKNLPVVWEKARSNITRKRSLSLTSDGVSSDDGLPKKQKTIVDDDDIMELEVGQYYTATIKSVKMFQLNILINGIVPGRIHISEISSNLPDGTNPLEGYKAGQQVNVRFIGHRYYKSKRYLPISHRNLALRAECSLKQEGSPDSLKIGKKVTVFIKEFLPSYIKVLISPEKSGRIYLLNLTSSAKVLKNPENEFHLGEALTATIYKINEEYIELIKIGKSKLVEGKAVTGQVLSARADIGVFLRLPLDYRGTVSLTDLRDSFKPADTVMEWLLAQHFVRCQLLSVDHSTKQCVLSTRSSRLKGGSSKEEVVDREIASTTDVTVGEYLHGYVTSVNERRVLVTIGRGVTGSIPKGNLSSPKTGLQIGSVVKVRIDEIKDDKITLALANEVTKEKTLEETSSTPPKLITLVDKEVPRLQLRKGFTWNTEPVSSSSSSEESSSESDDGEERGRSKKRKLNKEQKEEDYLFQRERELMNIERQPETADDYERLILASPNNSMIWLKYMAFHLEQIEIEKAKAIGFRALKTISFREEQEKLNIWKALLNLELSYGTDETLKETFNKAVQYNEPNKVYKHMVNLYVQANKYDEAEELYKTMIKKFKYDKEIHIEFGLFFMRQKKLEAARNIMQRSLNVLEKKDHIDVISRFAQMEFKYGDAERGTTMFENILSNYPKRTDIWSVYIDQTQKHGDKNAVRHLFERVITLKASPKRMKFFFKRYLEFEKQNGTDETVEKVKQKAMKYVEMGES